MRRVDPYTPEQRARAEQLARATARTLAEIAAELGIPTATLRRWAAAGGWRGAPGPQEPRGRAPADPATWPPARRAAAVRISQVPGVARQDLARALGVGRSASAAFLRALGLPARRRRAAAPPRPGRLDPAAAGGPALRAALRGHVARQIAALDAALAADDPALPDSARVLRDLGGLKRLLDELTLPQEDGDAERSAADDLPALRADLARRLVGLRIGGPGRGGSGAGAERPAAPGPAGAGA